LGVSHKDLPWVPYPKKSYRSSKSKEDYSLRRYSKYVLESGQGEILNQRDMLALLKAGAYPTETVDSDDKATKIKFIEDHTAAGHPVLVAYLAGDDNTGIIPTITLGPDVGAHWSLIIGVPTTGRVEVVEPNAPKDLKEWSMDVLMDSNASCDRNKFVQFWEKTEYTTINRRTKKVTKREVSISSAPNVNPGNVNSWQKTDKMIKSNLRYETTKLYDLGGRSGNRHNEQQLNNVLIAIIPP
jgi:hypothetical protein